MLDDDQPLSDGEHRAVIDRANEEQATLLVGDHEQELLLPLSDLPDGVKDGAWLVLQVVDGAITSVTEDPAATMVAQERMLKRLGRIRRTQGGSRFGRSRQQ